MCNRPLVIIVNSPTRPAKWRSRFQIAELFELHAPAFVPCLFKRSSCTANLHVLREHTPPLRGTVGAPFTVLLFVRAWPAPIATMIRRILVWSWTNAAQAHVTRFRIVSERVEM